VPIVRQLSYLPAVLLTLSAVTAFEVQAQAPAQAAAPVIHFAKAKPGDLRVFMSGAMRPALDPVHSQLEAAVGRAVIFEVRQARALQTAIEEGAAFEAAMLTQGAMEALAKAGKVAPASLVHLADNPLGVTARGDLSKVDVRTPEGLKRTMLGAKAIRRFYGVGATVPLTDHVIEKLGVGEAIKDKLNKPGEGFGQSRTPTPLAPGEYELDFTLVSEINPRPGWSNLGVVPESLRIPNVMTAGVSHSAHPEHAAKLIAFLRSPLFKNALAATGMRPL
jgi:molybdate transport system substrate-binding protein